jgi:hypothetical protein
MSNKVIVKTASTSLIVILIGLLVTAAFWLKINSDKLRESLELSEQLAGNYEALTDTVRAYRFKVDKLTTLNTAIAYRASVEVKEWQAKNKHDAELIKKMGVKLNRLQSVTTSTLVTTDTVRVDSIVYVQGKTEYQFNSDYMKADVSINYVHPESSQMNYEYRNDLILTNEFQQKKFLFFKVGKKFKTAHIVSKDTNCKITKFEVREMIK